MGDNDLHAKEGVGGNQGEDTSTLDSEQEPQKTAQQLEQERSRAVAEMQKFMRKEKEARADNQTLSQEKAYLQVENAVLKDNTKIVEVYESNPDLAEEICKNNWGVSYAELVSASQQSTPDIESLVERKLSEREQKQVQRQIEETVISFLVEEGLTEKSPLFQQVIREYGEYPAPKTVAQAKKLVTMLYKDAKGDEGTAGDIGSIRTPVTSSTSHTPKGRQVSPEMKAFMEAKFGAEDVKKFLSTK